MIQLHIPDVTARTTEYISFSSHPPNWKKAKSELQACWEPTSHPFLWPTAAPWAQESSVGIGDIVYTPVCFCLYYRLIILIIHLKTTFGAYFICHKLPPSIPSWSHYHLGRHSPSFWVGTHRYPRARWLPTSAVTVLCLSWKFHTNEIIYCFVFGFFLT